MYGQEQAVQKGVVHRLLSWAFDSDSPASKPAQLFRAFLPIGGLQYQSTQPCVSFQTGPYVAQFSDENSKKYLPEFPMKIGKKVYVITKILPIARKFKKIV